MSDFISRVRSCIQGHPTSHGPSSDAPFPVLSLEEVNQAELRIGQTLPPLLVQLYTEIGNGGFGPGFGFLPLVPSNGVAHGRFVVDVCQRLRESKNWSQSVVPLVSWGAGILSCIDIDATESPPVYRFEPNLPDDLIGNYVGDLEFRGYGLIPEQMGLSEWLQEWLEGKADAVFERMNRI